MDPAESILVPLDFKDTLQYHKYSSINTDGQLIDALILPFAQAKTHINTNDNGDALAVTNNNNRAQVSVLESNHQLNPVTLLECWRPLIYEPLAYLKAMCTGSLGRQGNRFNRQVPTLLVSGMFRVRMIEGFNDAKHWANQIQIADQEQPMGQEKDGEINYGHDGFASKQYVRAICIVVTDMGQGYGQGIESNNNSIQDLSNPNFRNDDAAGVGRGAADTLNSHLLAPSLGDIFDNVGRDPENNYDQTIHTSLDYNNEDMISWTYKKNGANKSTPEHGQTDDNVLSTFFDPLRGSFRARKFHVVHDKKMQFQARGSQSSKFNQEGGRQIDFRWSVRLRNLRCQQNEGDNTYVNQNRSREQLSKRIFWYFIPSISPLTDGTVHAGSVETRGHHGFTVSRGPEKCFWTEKQDAA